GEVDGIIEHSAFGRADSRDSAATEAGDALSTTTRGVDASGVQGVFQQLHGAGEILQQFGLHVEAEHKCQVLLAQNLTEEFASDLFLHIEDIGLTAAGVDQDAEGQRKVRFCSKILNRLRLSVFEDLKIVLGQIGDQSALLVLHVEKELNHVD